MAELSVSDVERRSGVEKRPDETVGEYLTRVGEEAGFPPETVSAVVEHVNRHRFAPRRGETGRPRATGRGVPAGVASVGSKVERIETVSGAGDAGTDDGAAARAEAGGIEDETAVASEEDVVRPLGSPRVRGRVRVNAHVFLVLCLGLAVALANHYRGSDVASPTNTLCEEYCTTASRTRVRS